MPKLCYILGSALLKENSFLDMQLKVVLTKYGKVRLYFKDDVYYLQRHGTNTPPHMISHKAHFAAIKELEIKNVIGINSCGSLKKDIPPGEIVIPDDYIDFFNTQTFFDHEMQFTVPGLSTTLRKSIIDAAKKSKIKVVNKGIYIQARGPRLETKAEIAFYSKIADIVGMTMASEATLAKELGINYASICSVDNFANGLEKKSLSMKEIHEAQKKSAVKIKKLMASVAKVVK